jgi:hypothetical protein
MIVGVVPQIQTPVGPVMAVLQAGQGIAVAAQASRRTIMRLVAHFGAFD